MTANGSDPAISIQGLVLSAGDQVLLDKATARIEKGELVLLVGASGTGKSLTLSLLSGLLNPGTGVTASGDVRVLGHDALRVSEGTGVPGTGIVFQDFALLDDVDARGNVLFGLDHRDGPQGPDRQGRADALLDEFGLPGALRPAQMSGGMKQRLALARALAFGPELIFYDEPTSGLDPAMSVDVAQRIRRAHDSHGMTSVVVTHDLVSLRKIADRVLLLDPRARDLREVADADLDEALASLRGWRADDPTPRPPAPWLKQRIHGSLEASGDFVIGSVRTLVHLIPRYPSARWGLRFLWRYLRLGTLGTAIPFLALAGLMSGFTTTFFTFALLPMQGYTEPVLVEEFIGALGYALYRVIVPGITTLLFASRAGAAIAADVGNRVLTRQVDALRSHGIRPERYLLTGVTISSLLGIPLLFAVAFFVARAAAVSVFLATHPGHGPFSFNEEFHQLVGTWGSTGLPGGTPWVLAKLLISALGTAAIAYHVGMRSKSSGAAVAEGVTSTIIRATIFVLTVHMIFAFFEF